MFSKVSRIASLFAVTSLSLTAFAQQDEHNHDHDHGPTKVGGKIDAPFVPPINAPKPKPPVKLPSNVAAKVGNQVITTEEVRAIFDMAGGRPIVEQLIQSTILEQEAKRLGVTVSEAEIADGVKEAKLRLVQFAAQSGQTMNFEEIAAKEGFSNDLIRWSVRLDVLRRKTFAKSIEKQVPSRDDQRHLAHILAATVALPKPGEQPKPLTPEEQKTKDEESKAKIEKLLTDLKEGKIQWDEAAKQSDDTSNAQNGGDLGWYRQQDFDPEFGKAAFAITKENEIVGPVKSNFGWHLVKLIRIGKDLPPAEKKAYRDQQINAMTMNQGMQNNWLQSLRNGKEIVINREADIIPGAKVPARMLKATVPTTSKKPKSGKTAQKSTPRKP